MAVIDLSHVIRPGMVTYPGLPGPEITDHLTREESRAHYAPGTEFHIGRITMVANTGTYLDTPYHRFADGPDLTGVPLERLVDLEGLVVRVAKFDRPDITARDLTELAGPDVAGRAVLVHTGWDRHWGTERYGSGGHPHLTRDAAEWLAERGPALVGIDSVNIDDTAGGERPAHTALLTAGIPIVEHMRGLDQLPDAASGCTRPRPWWPAWARSRSACTRWSMTAPVVVPPDRASPGGEARDPSRTRQSPPILAAFRPWGGSAG